jgi:DNA-binding transcriptional LysR family regulator
MDVHSRDLRYFVAVAEELHFTRAAERLFVSQPALSKQIRMLERTLGVALFERRGREVRLTTTGARLLPDAQRLLADWDAAAAAVEDTKRRQQLTLVVGMSTSPARGGLLPAIRSRFTAIVPQARLRLRQVGWEDASAGLADGSSDVAFVWLPLPDQERYEFVAVAEEDCLVVMPEDHPLAQRDTLAFSDLLDEPFLALPASAGSLRDYWLALDRRNGRPPVIGAEITSPDETYEALVDGRGICLVAAGNAPSLTRGGVIARPVAGAPRCTLALAWLRGNSNRVIAAYVQAAAAVAADSAQRPTAALNG